MVAVSIVISMTFSVDGIAVDGIAIGGLFLFGFESGWAVFEALPLVAFVVDLLRGNRVGVERVVEFFALVPSYATPILVL